jgi:5'-phosphate synthase pdxT subunit
MSVKIGVLAIQGDFREHQQVLNSLGVEVVQVRLPKHLEGLAGLIVPGGESTTIGMLAREYGLEEAVRERVQADTLAVWGTCAGAIWLARRISQYPNQPRLGCMDITIQRNGYGRQVDSFEADLQVRGLSEPFRAFFIRAPLILEVGPEVDVLAEYQGMPVLVQAGRLWASTFHPELAGDARLHDIFVRCLSK